MRFIFESQLLEGIHQDFKATHGEKLFDLFMSLRSKLEPPYNDMSYWMTKSSEELEKYLNTFEPKTSNREIRNFAKRGAELVAQDGNIRLYFITTYEAMVYYGKGTKWCIAGNYPGQEGKGKEFFRDYMFDYDLDGGYYVITDGKDKYCILVNRDKDIDSVWDSEDSSISEFDLPESFLKVLENYSGINCAEAFDIEDDTLIYYRGKGENVVIPYGVTSIGRSAFSSCSELTSVIIPDSVKIIGNLAFAGCNRLNDITIGNSIIYIGVEAFWGCSSLTEITIPDSVVRIDVSAFKYCTGLTNVKIGEGVKCIGSSAFYGCTGLTNVTIPGNIEGLHEEAFKGCTKLASVTISNGVTYIGDRVFQGCSDLTSVIIPDSVTDIGAGAFDSCTSLKNITIPNGVMYIDAYTFNGCSALKSVTIPGSVDIIDDFAFYDCARLTNVHIYKGVTTIGKGAFMYCDNIKNITIPDSVTRIGKGVFGYCDALENVYYSGSENDWRKIIIKPDNNECLESANIHYNSAIDESYSGWER